MTIETTQTRVDYSGNGVTTAFAIPYDFFGLDELRVILRTAAGAETLWVRGVNYTVTGGSGGTGTLTATVAPATGTTLVIRRDTDRLQTADYVSNDDFPAETHELVADRAVAMVQELEEQLGRTLRVAETDAPLAPLPNSTTRANGVQGYDAFGQPVILSLAGGGIQGPQGPMGPPGASVAVGAVTPFAGSTLPLGYLWCDGSAVSRVTYAALFAAIGTTYGSGDGSTTFNVPDYRGRVAIGKDDLGAGPAASRITVGVSGIAGGTLGATGGSQALHGHTHGYTDVGHSHSGTSDTAGAHNHSGYTALTGTTPATGTLQSGTNVRQDSTLIPTDGNHFHALTINANSTGITILSTGAGASQNVQPGIVQNWIIYAQTIVVGGVVVTPASASGIIGVSGFIDGLTLATDSFRWSAPAACRLPAGAAGCFASASAVAASLTTFTLNRVPGGTGAPVSIGTLTYAGASRTGVFSVAAAVDFAAGDVLDIGFPGSPDSTLADVNFTITLSRI
jgi:microcystin-dependent protein